MTAVNTDQVDLRPGMTVKSRDDEKLGKIVRLENNQVLVEKGFFFPQDYWIPASAIENADDDNVYLNVDKDQVQNQQWSQTTGANRSAAGYGIDQSATTAGVYGADAIAGTVDQTAVGSTGTTRDYATRDAMAKTSTDDTLTIPVREEELTATKHAVDAGDVVINTNVVSEDRTLEVPITEERVRVTRRAVDRAANVDDANAFKEDTIDVPVRTEAVDVQKRVRVAEEVEVAKEAVTKNKTVSGTVRREEVTVNDNTNADVIDGTTGVASGFTDTTSTTNKNKNKNNR